MPFHSFIDYLKIEKRYSPLTIRAYTDDLQHFLAFLSEQYDLHEPAQAKRDMIRDWIATLVDKNYKPTSVNRKLSSVKGFFRFVKLTGQREDNPTQGLRNLKSPKRLIRTPTQDDLRILLEDLPFGEGFKGLRDRMMMTLLYLTGMRRSEIISLRAEDVDVRSGYLRIIGKGNKERQLPIPSMLARLIDEYLRSRSEIIGEHTGPFFITEKGKKVYPGLVHAVVNHYLREVTTLKKASPHVLRHAFATHLLQQGANLNAIKELLGHENLAATQVYTHVEIDKLKSVYNQAHPRNSEEGGHKS